MALLSILEHFQNLFIFKLFNKGKSNTQKHKFLESKSTTLKDGANWANVDSEVRKKKETYLVVELHRFCKLSLIVLFLGALKWVIEHKSAIFKYYGRKFENDKT